MDTRRAARLFAPLVPLAVSGCVRDAVAQDRPRDAGTHDGYRADSSREEARRHVSQSGVLIGLIPADGVSPFGSEAPGPTPEMQLLAAEGGGGGTGLMPPPGHHGGGFGIAAPVSPGSGTPIVVGTPIVIGSLDPASIARIIEHRLTDVALCRVARAADAQRVGTIALALQIGADGQVTSASSGHETTPALSTIAACVAERARRWTFAAPHHGLASISVSLTLGAR